MVRQAIRLVGSCSFQRIPGIFVHGRRWRHWNAFAGKTCLDRVVNNNRFLILPNVIVSNLASALLARTLHQTERPARKSPTGADSAVCENLERTRPRTSVSSSPIPPLVGGWISNVLQGISKPVVMKYTIQKKGKVMEEKSYTLVGGIGDDIIGSARVFVVDDSTVGRKVLEEIVRTISSTITVACFDSPLPALDEARTAPPDLILVDYRMPQITGAEFTRRLRKMPGCSTIPVVIVTIFDERDVRYESLEAGATDFLTRPLDPYECKARCYNLLALHRSSQIIKSRADWLEQEVAKATRQILNRERETLLILARVGDYHDRSTGKHILRMAKYSRLIAEGLGLPEEHCHFLELAAPMHDIGKIGIPDRILLKEGPLTPEEETVMKTHTQIGYEILRNSSSEILRLGGEIALGHQERFDGSGYPYGYSGETISLDSRIVAVADVFDALTTARPYKPAWAFDDAYRYMLDNAGRLFDPTCIRSFASRIDIVEALFQEMRDKDG